MAFIAIHDAIRVEDASSPTRILNEIPKQILLLVRGKSGQHKPHLGARQSQRAAGQLLQVVDGQRLGHAVAVSPRKPEVLGWTVPPRSLPCS